jgi:hypothetical protein
MFNEMRRPCTLPASWKQPNGRPIEPFDAIGATVLPSGRDMGVYTKDGRVIRFEFATREALEIGYMEAITTIANALNAPVLATDAVLAGLPKDAKAFVVLSTGNMCKMTWAKDCWEIRDGDYYMEVEPEDSFRIIADKNDPKTAEYLRNNFTLDGVRIKEGG